MRLLLTQAYFISINHQHQSSASFIRIVHQHRLSASFISIILKHHSSASYFNIIYQHHLSASFISFIHQHQHHSAFISIIHHSSAFHLQDIPVLPFLQFRKKKFWYRPLVSKLFAFEMFFVPLTRVPLRSK